MTADVTSVVAAGSRPVLPAGRGPLSASMISVLTGHSCGELPDPAGADPFGEDLQLALYLAYELHYRGFCGVSDEMEWDPDLLAARRGLESRFLHALHAETAAAAADLDSEIAGLLHARSEQGVAAYLAGGGGGRAALREIVVHRSMYHLKEADPQAFAIPRLTGAAKAAVVAVEFDEYGGGHPARMHSALFAQLMIELDLDPGYGAYLDAVPAPMLAVVNFMSLCGLHRSLRGALVGQLAAVEITSPAGSALMVRAITRHGGGEAAQAFYAEHVIADSVHERVMRDAIHALAAEGPGMAAEIAFGIRAAAVLDERLDRHVLDAWAAGHSSLRRALD
jgi:hypothetical protein